MDTLHRCPDLSPREEMKTAGEVTLAVDPATYDSCKSGHPGAKETEGLHGENQQGRHATAST